MTVYKVHDAIPNPRKGPYEELGCAEDSKHDRVRHSQSGIERAE